MPPPTIRGAVPQDDARVAAIATEGNASAPPHYLEFVRSVGRLLVAEIDALVAGFGGVIDIGGVAMVTDLFVTSGRRGAGIGGRVLDVLLTGFERRMTFSSQHAAAVPAYRRAGMEPSWTLLYFEGVAAGGGAPIVAGEWRHDRPELVRYQQRLGALVRPDAVLRPDEDRVSITRLHSDRPGEVFDAIVSGYRRGTKLTFCTPEHSPLATAAVELGCRVVDHDTFCATAGVEISPALHCLHPGLC